MFQTTYANRDLYNILLASKDHTHLNTLSSQDQRYIKKVMERFLTTAGPSSLNETQRARLKEVRSIFLYIYVYTYTYINTNTDIQ